MMLHTLQVFLFRSLSLLPLSSLSYLEDYEESNSRWNREYYVQKLSNKDE